MASTHVICRRTCAQGPLVPLFYPEFYMVYHKDLFFFNSLLYPRGSKYPTFQDSGPKNHTFNIGYLDPLGTMLCTLYHTIYIYTPYYTTRVPIWYWDPLGSPTGLGLEAGRRSRLVRCYNSRQARSPCDQQVRAIFPGDPSASTPQLLFKEPQIPSNGYHNALNRGTLGGLGIYIYINDIYFEA